MQQRIAFFERKPRKLTKPSQGDLSQFDDFFATEQEISVRDRSHFDAFFAEEHDTVISFENKRRRLQVDINGIFAGRPPDPAVPSAAGLTSASNTCDYSTICGRPLNNPSTH